MDSPVLKFTTTINRSFKGIKLRMLFEKQQKTIRRKEQPIPGGRKKRRRKSRRKSRKSKRKSRKGKKKRKTRRKKRSRRRRR